MKSTINKRIYIIGFMGAGKTYWGKKWSEVAGYKFKDLDEEIEKKKGNTIAELFKVEGESKFREIETEVLKELSTENNLILSCGGGTPCFNHNFNLIKKAGLSVYLHCDNNVLLKRLLKEKAKRPLISNFNEAELKAFIENKIKERDVIYRNCDVIIEEDAATTETIKEIING